MRNYLIGDSWFAAPESRTVIGLARRLTKSDLELAIGNTKAAEIFFLELQRELQKEADVSMLLTDSTDRAAQ